MRFFRSDSDIVYKLMITLCQIKIANTSGKHWGIESEYHLQDLLAKFSEKFITQKKLKDYRYRVNRKAIHEVDLTLALRLQFHQLNQVQELSQERSTNLCPSIYLTDSS